MHPMRFVAGLLGGICDAVSKNRSPLLSSMLGP